MIMGLRGEGYAFLSEVILGKCSSRHFEEEVDGEEAEDGVGSPSGEQRREQAGGTHGFEQSRGGAVNDSNADGDSQTADGAARSSKERKGCTEKHDDSGDKWESEFLMPLDGEARRVEASLAETRDVRAKLAPAHLVGLKNFTPEIAGRFGEFGEGKGFECRVANATGIKIADPTAGEDPGLFGGIPGCAGGIDAAANLEGVRIEFENAQASEEIADGIKELVVKDLVPFAENPLMRRLKVGLCRLALDFVAKGVLALVSVGKVRLAKREHARSDQTPGNGEREDKAIQADAASLESDDFVIFGENGQSDQRC